MIPYKNRTIDYTKPVLCYKNLTRDCFSIVQSGKVVAHSQTILLKKCTFHVNELGRQRVCKTKHKSVHAWIKGYLTDNPIQAGLITWKTDNFPARIKYDPYKWETFICDNLTNHYFPVKSAMAVQLSKNGVFGAYLNV